MREVEQLNFTHLGDDRFSADGRVAKFQPFERQQVSNRRVGCVAIVAVSEHAKRGRRLQK